MKNETKRTSHLSVLYIEGNSSLQQEISTHLKKIFSKVYQAFSGEEGLISYKKNKPDIVLTDLELTNTNSFEMIVNMQEIDPKVSIVVLSHKNGDFELLETLDLGIVALLAKPLRLSHLNRALQKIILLKPNKIQKPKKIVTKTKTVQNKAIKTEVVKTKPVKVETIDKESLKITSTPNKIVQKKTITTKPKKVDAVTKKITKPLENKELNVKPKKIQQKPVQKKEVIDYTTCNTIITNALKNKTNITCVNSYKGLVVSNAATLIKVDTNSFVLQGSKTQLFAVANEKKIILNIQDKHILAKLLRVNKIKNQITLKNPQFIKYQNRNKNNKRLAVDKSFKSTIGYENSQKELTPIEVSYDYIALETIEDMDIQENSSLELTMGFEIDAPSRLVHEKKFTKVFATGVVKRVHKTGNKLKIIIEHKIQVSGQNVYKQYLQQREIAIINEFKMKMKS